MLIFGILSISAQDDPDEIVTVDSSIVRLNVGVVDNRGRPITSLNKNNFTIYEDGIKQEISRFEPTVSPFSVVLMLDMSGSTIPFRDNIQLSARRFMDALAPDDRVAVVEFSEKINLLNDFTTDRKTIAHSISVAGGRGKTQLYKAIDFALSKLVKENNRRKAIIVLTDGVDTNVQNADRDLLEKLDDKDIPGAIKPENSPILNNTLNRSDVQGVTIYPLALPTNDPARLIDPTPAQIALFSAARERLQILANRTGGTLNKINRLEEMARLYAEVAADLRTLYTIEYEPKNSVRDGKWREIKLEVSNNQLISRTRPGYYAKKPQ
ncbi:MAG: VWA domain-containing protein [Pyrinomonadaceae bacterium]